MTLRSLEGSYVPRTGAFDEAADALRRGARVRHDWWYAKISLAGLIS